MFNTNLSCGSRYQTKLKLFICTSHNVYLRISKHINDLNQPPISTTTVYVRDTSTSRYEGQCLWNQMHNRNCRSKKKRMAKHIGLIRWIAIICAWLPHLDTEEYRTMKIKLFTILKKAITGNSHQAKSSQYMSISKLKFESLNVIFTP